MEKKSVILEMDGAAFKRLVEQRSPDGKIDTIPEAFDFLQGIREGETLEAFVKRIIAEMFHVDGDNIRIVVPEPIPHSV